MADLRFTLNYDSANPRTVYPKYSDKLAIDVGHDSNEEYYREKLSGTLTFVNDDYTYITTKTLDTKFTLLIEYKQLGSWFTLLYCYFYQTDCDIDADNKILSVTPTTDDGYEEFIGGLDKEYDLVKLAPKITPVMLDKRPCLQFYALGDTKLTNILSNMSWEQDCNEERDHDVLVNTCHFRKWDDFVSGVVSGTHTPSVPTLFSSSYTAQTGTSKFWSIQSGSYYLKIDYDGNAQTLDIFIQNGNVTLFEMVEHNVSVLAFPRTAILNAVAGSGATGQCIVNLDIIQLYVRMMCDVDTLLGVETKDLPLNDIVENNRNYSKVSPVPQGGALAVGANDILSNTPTEWGIYQPNQYYTELSYIGGIVLPVCRHRWSRVSYWIGCGQEVQDAEAEGRQPAKLKDAYLLTDVINALLNEISPGRTLTSSFLLTANNPINTDYPGDEDIGRLIIAPKSNVLEIGYTQAAQKAPITLRQILDMLRSAYRCYWLLQGTSGFRIEHIKWFRLGGRYTGSPIVGVDLTAKKTVRNNKYWDYETYKYKYDKPEMPCRYEFGWATETTLPFSGRPLVMNSGFVNLSSVEKINVPNCDADIDYLLLNPGAFSKDGFAIMKAQQQNIIASPITVYGSLLITVKTIIIYNTDANELVDVDYTCVGSGTIYATDGAGNIISQLDSWNTNDSVATTWTIPAGTARIVADLPSGSSFTLENFEPPIPKVTYRNFYPNPYDTTKKVVMQNGYLSFAFLPRYYDYDMPCKSYNIGEGAIAYPMIAKGVSKKKTQSVTVPQALNFDAMNVVNTNLGYGKIRKMNINLSSEAAETTLEYDTK